LVSSKCTPCGTGISACSAVSKATACLPGFFLTITAGTCTSCGTGVD